MNKALHGFEAFYEVKLPDIFTVVHPVGTVLGRGTYSDYFCVYQGCTVGANLAGEYPSFGRGVVLYGGSRVIGRSRIGSNCLIAAGTTIIDRDIPDGHVGFGQHPQTASRPTRHDVVRTVFGVETPPAG